MNLIDLHVVEVLSEPYERYGGWFVKVSAEAWGSVSENTVMCKTFEDALKVQPGFVFQG
jgi:hypothetical protein